MSETQTIRALLQKTRAWFEKKGIESARLDAELLLAHALNETRLKLYMDLDRPLTPDEVDRYRALVARRGAREPVAYLVGEREFYGHAIAVRAGVLVPRPETEHLVEEALARLPEDRGGTLIDVCTGSGCVAIAIAIARPALHVIAIDVDDAALAIARENVARHALTDRVIVEKGDLLAGVTANGLLGVVANPPYVTAIAYDGLMKDVRDHEPRVALVGDDDDGLGHHRRILEAARARLGPRGFVAMEIGADQERGARALGIDGLAFDAIVQDLDGHPRVAIYARSHDDTFAG